MKDYNNEYGIKVGSLGASFEQETYRGDGVIMLYDRTGEFGWMTDGKSSNNHIDWILILSSEAKDFLDSFLKTDMVLDENILSKYEYEKALAGKTHFRDAWILFSSNILMIVKEQFAWI